MDRMRQMDDEADQKVLQDIIDIMGQMNGKDMDTRKKSYVEVKLEEPVDQEGAGDNIEAEALPGEEASEIPETNEDEELLRDSIDDEDELSGEKDLRRKAKIF